MSLSLSRLQTLLQEDGQRRRDEETKTNSKRQQSKSFSTVWQAHGVLSPRAGVLKRPIPDSLFQCPVSQPLTTLVEWDSLPQTIQAKLKKPPVASITTTVEVPLTLLEQQDTTTTSRRLIGNLSSKLSEYTRGVSGQSRPFRPGGLGDDNNKTTSNTPEDDEMDVDVYRTPQAIERSMQVLRQGSEASWKDGTIITAPPGVTFKAGLTLEQFTQQVNNVESSSETVQTDENHTTATLSMLHPKQITEESSMNTIDSVSGRPAAKLFTQAMFDDDSLFGSSSSESEDDDDDEEAEEEPLNAGVSVTVPTTVMDVDLENLAPIDEDDNVDELLTLLTESTQQSFSKKTSETIAMNPLNMAVRQAKDQNDVTRKSWASTTLLPIRDFQALIPNSAMTFPFVLDGFQQQAVARLERSESVFVAAHTSAGKTVVAEYAVALAKQRATRCVYTSPIKALSNQKFRDFSLKFGSESIGLITGDLQVNVDDSTCLIMTTEILRSMLYRGADLIRDIEWVIFDEVHYINDAERGVVWEEVIIMLPSYVNLIFLSATTPNTIEFSDWIGRTKRKPIHVIKTDYRPVPLSFHLWAGLELHKIMEGKGGFIESGYKAATMALLPPSAKDPKKKADPKAARPPATGSKQLAWQAQGSKQNWMSLVRYLEREMLTPTVVFSFSQKKCEEIAQMLRSLDLNTAKERSAVQGFCKQAVARLSRNDAELPQVMTVCEMVQRGIGIHHGGLLPILKEVVEILFGKGLIKVLFATETFAMGVNMPARSVVFNSIRKHDGTQFRVLDPGEFVQMSGRSGRRQLDLVGTVILCCFGEEPPPQQILKQMLTGSSTLLSSQFRLTYNMILNLLRVEEISVESMIARSFSEFATQRALTTKEYPQLLKRGTRTLRKLESRYLQDAHERVGLEDLDYYYELSMQLMSNHDQVLEYVLHSESALFHDICCPGRVVFVTAARKYHCVRAPAVILQSKAATLSGIPSESSEETTKKTLICMILMPTSYIQPCEQAGTPGTLGHTASCMRRLYSVRTVSFDQIVLISNQKHKIDVKSLYKEDVGSINAPPGNMRTDGHKGRDISNPFAGMKAMDRQTDPFAGMTAVGKKKTQNEDFVGSGATKSEDEKEKVMLFLLSAEQAERENASGLALLDLSKFVKRGPDIVVKRQLCQNCLELSGELRSSISHYSPNLEKYYGELERQESLRAQVDTLQHLLSNESLSLFPDFTNKKAVLRKLGYIDEHETVCVKGRVACECNSAEELILTEMVFEGILNELEPEEIAAVLSALVYQGKSTDEELDIELPERLVTCCEQMKTIATNLGMLQKELGLEVDPGEYCDNNLKFGLVHVVYEWSLGVPFKNICDLTDVKEGLIVRAITRLDELLREVRNCARVIGNPSLYRKLEAASVAIKRDIVFASSLYVS